jgi:alkylation response protein AidB-like acyl-CoA dehydrogenase
MEGSKTMPGSVPPEALVILGDHAGRADAESIWPAASWEALRQADVLKWSIPPGFGGAGKTYGQLLHGYEVLAGACLTTCFLLSQREAAVRRLRDGDNERLSRDLLPGLARGEHFATVGLSQLTTSRQHVQPSLRAQLTADALILEGSIPWVTGAVHADHFVIGAVLDNGQQVLAVLPAYLPEVKIGPPLDLSALAGSLTAEVHCHRVVLDRKWILAGPADKVLATGRGGAGGLETSCLAIGLAGAAIAFLEREAAARADLLAPAERLEHTRRKLHEEMHRLARHCSTAEDAAALRTRANKLVLRATQAALMAAKGTGFVRSHPAQRWARQALFFLVWSCPGPVAKATLASLACDADGEWAS